MATPTSPSPTPSLSPLPLSGRNSDKVHGHLRPEVENHIPTMPIGQVYCPVRAQPGDTLDTATFWLSTVLPTALGPVLSLALFLVTLPCTWSRRDLRPSCPGCLLLPALILLHLASYVTHFLLAERLQLEEFHYLVVKYGLGQSFTILIPFAILGCCPELRRGVRTTFSSAVLCPPIVKP